MSIKLTDTQFIMLNAAAQREDRCLVASSTLKGAAALKLANKLISAGFVEEIDRRRIGNHENQRFRVLLRGLAERAEKTGFPFE